MSRSCAYPPTLKGEMGKWGKRMTYVFEYVTKDLICIGSLVRLFCWCGTRRSVARGAVGEHGGEHAEKVA